MNNKSDRLSPQMWLHPKIEGREDDDQIGYNFGNEIDRAEFSCERSTGRDERVDHSEGEGSSRTHSTSNVGAGRYSRRAINPELEGLDVGDVWQ